MQGIRNDDESLSPVIPLVVVFSFFSVVPNHLEYSGTFVIYWFLGIFNALAYTNILQETLGIKPYIVKHRHNIM